MTVVTSTFNVMSLVSSPDEEKQIEFMVEDDFVTRSSNYLDFTTLTGPFVPTDLNRIPTN